MFCQIQWHYGCRYRLWYRHHNGWTITFTWAWRDIPDHCWNSEIGKYFTNLFYFRCSFFHNCPWLSLIHRIKTYRYVQEEFEYTNGVNQNPYIEEEQTTQWPKEKVQKNKQQHTHKAKNRITRIPLKTGVNSGAPEG